MSEAKPLPIVAFIRGVWLVLVKSQEGHHWEQAGVDGFAVAFSTRDDADKFAGSLTS